jgi:hypothetical protein
MVEEATMTKVDAQIIGDKALLPRDQFDRLVELARRSDDIDVRTDGADNDSALLRLAEQSGAFDFWKDSGEDIYSEKDGTPA